MKNNISELDEMATVYVNYCKKNHKYFEYNFLKNKTLKEILYSPMRKMFLKLGISMFLCQFLYDISCNIRQNQDFLNIDKNLADETNKKFKNMINLFNKILKELEILLEML